ncbi:MAG: glycoside hydrolase family 31 protein [Deltaproteobacteria bacterium]|nr:glycoside hydrolase family 31 protein [Deltaproteobacteria bacterium]
MRFERSSCLALALALCAACSDGGDGPGPDLRPGLLRGAFGLYFDQAEQRLSLERLGEGGQEAERLLELDLQALQLGQVDAVSDGASYDPWPLYVDDGMGTPPPKGLAWLDASAAELGAHDQARMRVQLGYPGGVQAELEIALVAEGSYRLRWVPSGGRVALFRLRPRVDSQEGFYGLGAYLDQVEHRGRVRGMQIELDLELESGYNEAHEPVPFVIGTRGWGLFVECPYPGLFDVASRDDDRVAAVFGTGLASGEGLAFYLFAAGHPLDLTGKYYDVSGYPILPAPWALGPWIWRDENDDQAQVERDARTIRELDLATTAIWIDRPYASGVNTFDFEPARFPDPGAMIGALHGLGFRLALWHTPYVDSDDPACEALYAHAVEQGFFPPQVGLMLNSWSYPIDLTNPDAYAWWQDLVRTYTDMGVEGFKLDYAEDVVPGAFGARNKWLFADGSDERTMHGRYQHFYHRLYAETLPAEGGFLLCRHAAYGDQVHASVIWPGDLDANMARHRERCTDRQGETYTAVGGLPASVIFGLSLGPSGFPFYGADTGGYQHAPPDKETFVRWFEQTALSSVMQVGTSTNDVAWEPTPENGFDEQVLELYRLYARLHLRLWPYAWSLAQRIAVDGRPLQRPLGLAYPELGVHPDDIYLFGPDLLVAPVLERGATAREVIFPPGRWVDWFRGEPIEGGQTRAVDAPLGKLPLYLRQGGIVPLLRPTIDTLSPTAEPGLVDSYASSPGVLYARIAPGEASSFALFDGTELFQASDAGGLAVGVKPGEDFDLGVLFELLTWGAQAPVGVTCDGRALEQRSDRAALEAAADGWALDPELGGLLVKVGPGEHAIEIERG